ncbi:MAG: SMI1/KNR4 family protein [Thermoguttaceae bacterium]
MTPEYEYDNALFEYRQATDEDFDNFERETKLKLPENFKEFIKEAGTKSPDPDTFPISGHPIDDCSDCQSFYGFPGETLKEGADEDQVRSNAETCSLLGEGPNDGDALLCNWKTFRGRVPSDLLPFGSSSFGDQICLKLEGDDAGSVWIWFNDEEVEPEGDEIPRDNCYFCANSLEEFLEGFVDEEDFYDDEDE